MVLGQECTILIWVIVGMKWDLNVVLICPYLMTNNVEHMIRPVFSNVI